MIQLPKDFVEFLQLLNSNEVEYLVVGGYAVGLYGYPRATVDLDVWVASTPWNAGKLVSVLKQFGFDTPVLSPELFTQKNKVIRMGNPPIRIEILTTISGVEFPSCYARRNPVTLGGTVVNFIHPKDLLVNKQAAGRHKDLNDLDNLPPMD
jgi:predicted nucleotidyltransferase